MSPRPEAFPNLGDAKERLAGRGFDLERSFRDFLKTLTRRTDDELDELVSEGVKEGTQTEMNERFSRYGHMFGRPLSPSERDVIAAAANGLEMDEIAAATRRSVHTVRTLNRVARAKLGAKNTPHAVALAALSGQIDLGALHHIRRDV